MGDGCSSAAVPVGVVLRTTEGQSLEAEGATELGHVVLDGDAGRAAPRGHGRRRVAEVEVTGGDAAVEALWAAGLGLS